MLRHYLVPSFPRLLIFKKYLNLCGPRPMEKQRAAIFIGQVPSQLRNCSNSQSESLLVQLEFISSNYIFISYGEQLVIFLCIILVFKFLKTSRSCLSYQQHEAAL